MRIAVISDTHDHLENLEGALLMGLLEDPGWLLFDLADGSERHFTVRSRAGA